MIVPDLNLLIYAHYDGAPRHEAAKRWWEGLVNGSERVGIPWVVATGFVRLITNSRVVTNPATPAEAIDYVQEWFQFPHVVAINPGSDHLIHLRRNLVAAGVGADLVTDAHVASVAMEYQAELHSNDIDFSRFPGLKWRNPL